MQQVFIFEENIQFLIIIGLAPSYHQVPYIPIQFQCTKCQELLFEMKLIMFKVTKGMMIGNHCLQQVKGMMIGNHRLQQVTRVTRVTCMKVIEKFTISALSCINCFACSPQIAGTVNTQRISSSEQWSFDLSS